MTVQQRELQSETKHSEKDIPITNLKLDEYNFRTDEVDSQRAAILAMINEQGLRLVKLAEHYLKHGLSPGERLLVIPDDEEGEADSFVVMEGNRRTTMMKLLEQPSLAAETIVYSRFAELAKQYAQRPMRTLPCAILPDRDTAWVWVEAKHSIGMSGAGVEKWGAPATDRFNSFVHQTVSRWQATLNFLKNQGVDTKAITKGILKKTTAVTRVLNARPMRDVLGVRFTLQGEIEFENGDIAAGAALLNEMMKEMAHKDFTTNEVHSFADRAKFIERFAPLAVKLGQTYDSEENAVNISTSPETGNSSQTFRGTEVSGNGGGSPATPKVGVSENQNSARPGVRRHPRERPTLASTGRAESLNIPDQRLSQLYHEARKIKIEKNHTAIAAVLIRVFLELSCEYYLKTKNIPIPEVISKRDTRELTWHSRGIGFKDKLVAVLNHFDQKKKDPEFDEIRRGLGSQDHLHSPENLHAYVHGLQTIPSARDLVIIWDRYHPLFVKMFA